MFLKVSLRSAPSPGVSPRPNPGAFPWTGPSRGLSPELDSGISPGLDPRGPPEPDPDPPALTSVRKVRHGQQQNQHFRNSLKRKTRQGSTLCDTGGQHRRSDPDCNFFFFVMPQARNCLLAQTLCHTAQITPRLPHRSKIYIAMR